MANRVKEEAKNERIIRGLLKLPENRRCINCNSLGPQYVCINFWTFVCTTCSGIHREFTHRVKSVSMAKFTSQEVSALQGGGNARAKEIHFKEWDPQRQSVPDSSNVERLRDFIKHVYVDRRYTGERSFDKPPRGKMGDMEDSHENRRVDTYQGGSRSPPYEDTYDRRTNDRRSPGGRSDDKNYRRSPEYEQDNKQYGDYRKSPGTAIVNDWRREDRFGNGRRSEDSRISDGSSNPEGRSPDRQRDLDMPSPPIVRPVRDILGDNVTPLRVIEPPKTNSGRAPDGFVLTQRTASSSSLASSNGNPAELRRENSGILIDFDAAPEPIIATAAPLTQISATVQSIDQPASSSNADNWACFDTVTEPKVSQVPSKENSLESVLSQLSVSATVPGDLFASPFGSGPPAAASMSNVTSINPAGVPAAAPLGDMSASLFGSGAPPVTPMNNLMTLFPGGAPAPAPGSAPVLPSNGANSFVNTQPHSLFPANLNQFGHQTFTPPVGAASSNQPWNPSLSSNTQGPSGFGQATLAVSKPALVVASGVGTQPSSVEVNPRGRKELPEDFFAATYASVPVPNPGWQTGPSHGFGYRMPYNNTLPVPSFQHSSKSTNPFDLSNDATPVQTPMFHSMGSLQGALPNMAAPSDVLRTSSLNTPLQTWLPSQSSYGSAMPPQGPSYVSAMPPQGPSYVSAMPSGSYMGQQVPFNLPSRNQGVSGFGNEAATFGSVNSNEQLGGIHSAPAAPNISSFAGGNPFG